MIMLTEEVVRTGLAEALRIAEGHIPGEAELSDAPVLKDWLPSPEGPHIRLIGYVRGHPTIPNGLITTSPVLAVDPAEKWVRTVSRYYVLGPKIGDQNA